MRFFPHREDPEVLVLVPGKVDMPGEIAVLVALPRWMCLAPKRPSVVPMVLVALPLEDAYHLCGYVDLLCPQLYT